jgi:hypothetical protein
MPNHNFFLVDLSESKQTKIFSPFLEIYTINYAFYKITA